MSEEYPERKPIEPYYTVRGKNVVLIYGKDSRVAMQCKDKETAEINRRRLNSELRSRINYAKAYDMMLKNFNLGR